MSQQFHIAIMVHKICAIILIIISLHSLSAKKLDKSDKTSMKRAIDFMTAMDQGLNKLTTAASYAQWKWSTNVTASNLKIQETHSKAVDEFARKMYAAANKFPWKSFRGKNSTLYRWFELVAKGLGTIDPSGLLKGNEENPYSKMLEIFGKAKICPPKKISKECNISADEISKVFAVSRDPKVWKHYWLEFRKQTGEKYRELFLQAVLKDNKDAKSFGYKNKARLNIAFYEDKGFVKNMADEMKKIQPFYKQIHAYVRKKLSKHLKDEKILPGGPIPAHLLGNIYAQSWTNIFDIVKPYKNSTGLPNVTKAMRKKKMEPIDIFLMAENFFKSIGLEKMTPRFWHFSMIKKPSDRVVECHPSAHDFHEGDDYRIKMCAKVGNDDLETIHHEMGHIEYYMLFNHLPFLFRDSANPGFHEAIGDAISLSVSTPSYLSQIGLLERKQVSKSKQFTINYLLNMALKYAVTLPYDYIIDLWRNQVYEGKIKDIELNKKYWQLRFKYQGVCPPALRTEKHFDIGAKWHIAGGVEYNRYYVANILQFQIHKILCNEADHKGPLHECNIYKNKKAGKALRKFLSQGRSKNWKELLRSFSGGKFNKIDASAMLEYFQPLIDWLKKKNVKEDIGWKSENLTYCPGYDASDEDKDKINSDATGSGGTTSGTTSFGITGSGGTTSGTTSFGITGSDTTGTSGTDTNTTGAGVTDTSQAGSGITNSSKTGSASEADSGKASFDTTVDSTTSL